MATPRVPAASLGVGGDDSLALPARTTLHIPRGDVIDTQPGQSRQLSFSTTPAPVAANRMASRISYDLQPVIGAARFVAARERISRHTIDDDRPRQGGRKR